jgi:hypothetical protein
LIALSVNKYIWNELKKDPALNVKYDKYRAKYGADFLPFFPVSDNMAGDISWGSEVHILWDMLVMTPRRIHGSRRVQMVYTVVGTVQDLMDVKTRITDMFDYWHGEALNFPGYRVVNIDAWSTDRTRIRDKVRQLYSSTLIVEVEYISC